MHLAAYKDKEYTKQNDMVCVTAKSTAYMTEPIRIYYQGSKVPTTQGGPLSDLHLPDGATKHYTLR